MDAATVVLTIAASSVNRMMSRTRSNTRPPRAKRLTRYAASNPSIVLPTAMPIDGNTAPVVVIFAKKAPARIAGQTPYPSSTNAASAMPAGGQIVVTELLMYANRRPSFAAK